MKYINGKTLCLEYDEFVPHCMSKPNYDQSKSRGNITVHGLGGNGRAVFVEFESLPKKYKEAVKAKYGDPYEYQAKQPILDLIDWDHQAETFYRDYVLPTGMKLPDDYIEKYTQAASWLNTIGHLTTDKRALKGNLNITVAAFWSTITDLIKVKNIHLPASEKRLKGKIKDYKGLNYDCLVESYRFGNSNSRKIDDAVAEAVLIEMLSHDHQHDYTIIAARYNEWAVSQGKAPITPGAVGYWAKEKAYLITANRQGKAVNYGKFNPQIRRERPSAPLLLINSDDNVLDLYFIEQKFNKAGHASKNHYYRPVMYVVIDAFNDYILGYAIGETVTIELIKEAYRNAANHVKELLNGYYLPHQIQTDRWALSKGGELEKFYQSMAIFTPATARVAQGKYIERSFGTTWHQNLKRFINYSGQNITAKEKLNPDAVDRNKSNFPAVAQAPQQVAIFIEAMRQEINPKTGIPRQQEWLEAFAASEKSKQKAINAEKHLQLFGVLNTSKGRGNTLQPSGLTIKNGRLLYEIPAEYFPQHMGKKVDVYCDPYDESQVLVTDGKGLRFVAHTYVKSPSALADHTHESRLLLNSRLEQKKAIAAIPAEAQTRRRELLDRERINAQSLLQGGVLIKEVTHAAQRAVHGYVEQEYPELSTGTSIYDRL